MSLLHTATSTVIADESLSCLTRHLAGVGVPQLTRLVEGRERDTEQSNMLLLLLLVRVDRDLTQVHVQPFTLVSLPSSPPPFLCPSFLLLLLLPPSPTSPQAHLEYGLPHDVMRATLETAKLTKIG